LEPHTGMSILDRSVRFSILLEKSLLSSFNIRS